MLKSLAIIIVSLFTPHSEVLDYTKLDTVLQPSVLIRLKVTMLNPRTGEMHQGLIGCSGTYIAPTTVLTAAHCVTEGTINNIWIRGTNKESFEAKLIKVNPSKDLALIGIISKHSHVYSRLAKDVKQGESVINVGSPFIFEFLVSEGTVAQIHVASKPFTALYTITTAMINSGSSGGGAFNNRGELIGVNTMTAGGMFGWAGISMAVSLEDVKEFLK